MFIELIFLAQMLMPIVGGSAAAAPPPPALVAHAVKTEFGADVVTSGINTTGATLIVLGIEGYSSGYTPGSGTTGPVSDSATGCDSPCNTWNYLTNRLDNFDVHQMQIAYCYGCTVGANHVFTLSNVTSGSGIAVLAFSGTLTTSGVYNTGTYAVTNTAVTELATGNLVPSAAPEVVVSFRGTMSGTATSLGVTTLTLLDSAGGASAVASAYLVVSDTTTINATWSTSNAVEVGVNIASFKKQ